MSRLNMSKDHAVSVYGGNGCKTPHILKHMLQRKWIIIWTYLVWSFIYSEFYVVHFVVWPEGANLKAWNINWQLCVARP
jgi:hypothetical protein